MSQDVILKLKVSDDGTLQVFDQAADKMRTLDRSAGQASEGGFSSMVTSLTDIKSGFDMVTGGISQAYQFIDGMNAMGAAAVRAEAGFRAMAGSKADEWIQKMTTASRGLVDDTDLMQIGMKAISAGAVKSGEDLANLTSIGETLGLTFQGSAKAGVDSLTRVLEMVGSTRGLKTLGIDAAAVTTEFDKLKATMSKEDAWRIAVFDVAGKSAEKLAGTLDSTGTSWEKTKIKIGEVAEKVSIALLPAIDWLATGLSNAMTSGSQLVDILGKLHELDWSQRVSDAPFANRTAPNSGQTDQQSFDAGYSGLTKAQQAQGYAYLNMSPEDYFWAQSGSKPSDLNQYRYKGGDGGGNHGGLGDGAENMLDPELNAQADAEQKFLNILKSAKDVGREVVGDLHSGVEYLRQQAIHADEVLQAAKARKALTLDQAFNVPGATTIEGQQGGVMQAGIAAARQAQYDELKKKYGGPEADKRIAVFDQQSQAAMDQYAIATGAATKESLKFRDMNAELTKGLSEGRLTVSQYSAAILGLAKGAEDGATSMSKLLQADVQVNDALYGNKKTKSGTPDRAFGGANLSGITSNNDSNNQGMQDAIQAEVEKAKKIRDARDAAMEQAAAWDKIRTNTGFAAVAMDAYTKAYAAYKALQNAPDDFAGRKTPQGSEKAYDPLSSVTNYQNTTMINRDFGGADMSKLDPTKVKVFTTEMLAMDNATAKAVTDLKELILMSSKLQSMAGAEQPQYKGGKPTGGGKTVLGTAAALEGRYGEETGDTSMSKEQEGAKKTADAIFAATAKLNELRDAYPKVADAAESNSKKASASVDQHTKSILAAQTALNRLLNTSGQAVITVYSNVSGGGARGQMQ